ncbi:hypothetical protein ACVDG8_027700 [Mesorhizobium sp. ORM8.1]
MTELHTNGNYGNYEGYLAQMFNPAAVGGQFNPGVFGPVGSAGIGTGYGGFGAGGVPNAALAPHNPWAQNLSQPNALWPQQQASNPVQSVVQAAQHIAARQAVHAIQCAQALQQIVQHLAAQQYAQQSIGGQPQFGQFGQGQPQFGQGMGGAFNAGQIGQPFLQSYGWDTPNPINQALQQQVMQQLAQYLASQQPGQFRHGWVH